MAYFENTVNGSVINGTAENDTIVNNADNVTIYGYAGGDSIENSATVRSDGYGNWTTVTANNVIIQSGDGNDYVRSSGYEGSTSNVTIDAGAGNDTLSFYGDNLLVNAGIGEDSLQTMGLINSVVYLDEDNDSFHSYGGNNFTINGGNGDDSILVGCIYPEKIVGVPPENVMVIAGDGNDTVRNEGTNSTITAGHGNDTVYLSGSDGGSLSSFYYNLGDGDDQVRNYASTDTINISGASYSSATVDNNIVITVGEGTDSVGTITLIDAAGNSVNITGGTTETIPGGITTTISENANATDYVFILDYSNSMDDYMDRVVNISANFVQQLTNAGVDYRLGVVEYRDKDEVQAYDFTNDVNVFKENILTVKNKVGGSDEYGLTAIETALTMDYREDVSKHFIVLTDAGYQEDSSMSETTIANLNANSVKLDVIGMPYDKGTWTDQYECQPEWEPIATVTGGTFVTRGAFYDITGDYNSIFTSISGGGDPRMQLSRWSYNFTFPTSDDSSNVVLASAT